MLSVEVYLRTKESEYDNRSQANLDGLNSILTAKLTLTGFLALGHLSYPLCDTSLEPRYNPGVGILGVLFCTLMIQPPRSEHVPRKAALLKLRHRLQSQTCLAELPCPWRIVPRCVHPWGQGCADHLHRRSLQASPAMCCYSQRPCGIPLPHSCP